MADGSLSRVLVTGGAGFIGRHVVRALLDEGHEVTSADRHACTDDRASSVVGDLRDPAIIAEAVRPETGLIIHLAAVTSVLRSVQDPAGTYQQNVASTASLLEVARHRGVGTFLLASTNAVTGDVGRTTITEQTPLRPLTPYGATKAAGEMLLAAYHGYYEPHVTAGASRSTATAPRCATLSTSMTWWPASCSRGRPGTMAR
jgi:UDP-glucose 4-epimerase